MIIAILVSVAAGVFIVMTRNINSLLAEKQGLLTGIFFNYLTGLFFSFLFLLISRESIKAAYHLLDNVPIWAYFGGLFGIVVVLISNIITSKMSAFYMSLIIFIGQLFTGIVIDYFAFHLLSIGKILGGILVVTGLFYNLNIDKQTTVQ